MNAHFTSDRWRRCASLFFKIAFSSSKSRIRRCKSRTSWSAGRSLPLPRNGRSGCYRTFFNHWCSVVSGMPKSRATSAIGFFSSVTHGTACVFNAASYFVAIEFTSVGVSVSSSSSRCPWNRLTSSRSFPVNKGQIGESQSGQRITRFLAYYTTDSHFSHKR